MEKETKEFIRTLIIGTLIIILFMTFVISLSGLIEYTHYKQFKSEGYEVRFSFFGYGCEMKLRNQDGSFDWRCCNAGDSYVRENFGVKN